MKRLGFVFTVCAVFMLMGCATMIPIGTLYTEQTLPMMVTSNGGASSKTGVSQCTSMFGLIALGDCSIATAKKNGGITKVYSVDGQVKNILGIYGTYTLVVKGE
jgi:hypothetical protein